jgi:peptidoglycan/xylan/chitin deacetylase (PgdA/CDA1 family)
MNILFPNNKSKAFTLSYDDNPKQDLQLVQLLNTYGIKGSFNVNSGTIGQKDRLNKEEIQRIYKGHEVAIHTVNHPDLIDCDKTCILQEIHQDQEALKTISNQEVRGMAYPFGTYNKTVIDIIKTLPIDYSRTVKDTHNFQLPEDFYQLHPTCHHNDPLLETLIEQFKQDSDSTKLFVLWGHSWELTSRIDWLKIEHILKGLSLKDDIWFATLLDIVLYTKAFYSLQKENDSIHNPTDKTVWFTHNNKTYILHPQETILL